MDYSVLNPAIARIKELEEKGAFKEALKSYESLLAKDPDEGQRLVIAVGKATTLLRMKERGLALAVLEQASFDRFAPQYSAVAAVAYNIRASALQDGEQYNEALAAATHARSLAESATEVDPEIVGESIALQGFALASLGQLKQAIEHFDLAETMPLPEEIRASIPLFRNYCHERTVSELPSLSRQQAQPN